MKIANFEQCHSAEKCKLEEPSEFSNMLSVAKELKGDLLV